MIPEERKQLINTKRISFTFAAIYDKAAHLAKENHFTGGGLFLSTI